MKNLILLMAMIYITMTAFDTKNPEKKVVKQTKKECRTTAYLKCP